MLDTFQHFLVGLRGLYLGGPSNFIDCTVGWNTALAGGGIYAEYTFNNAISGSIHHNYGNSAGGGIDLQTCHHFDIDASVYSNDSNIGCGMYIYNSRTNSIGGSVFGNTGTYGGGLYINQSSEIELTGTIENNVANMNGGGVYLTVVSNSIFASTSVTRYNHCGEGYDGGGIFAANVVNVTVSSTAVTNPNYEGAGTSTIDNVYGL